MNPTVKYVVIYGVLAGAIILATILLGLAFQKHAHFLSSEWFGYLVMLVALTFVFLGVKRYRDNERGGVVKFGSAFLIGLSIAVVASLTYVITWEAYLAATHYTFMDHYIASIVQAKKAAGMSGAALAQEVAKLDEMRVQYANPLFRLPMTFLEIFPVGLLVALVSAALIRNPKFLPARA